ncbi:MAG: DUF3293 domain-containing protein [Acidimicrobiaceae bacterium]|nr:DUF3293 domain-containing protein [Acidimicrobiaceae bacterium]
MHELDEELWEEYLTARLEVLLPQGERVELRDCGSRYFGAASAVVLTAWNPMGKEASFADNERRNAELAQDLANLEIDFLPCVGSSIDASYQEVGFIAFDLDEQEALRLLDKYQQIGYYYVSAHRVECVLSESNFRCDVRALSDK